MKDEYITVEKDVIVDFSIKMSLWEKNPLKGGDT
jgi:hypothetical protein